MFRIDYRQHSLARGDIKSRKDVVELRLIGGGKFHSNSINSSQCVSAAHLSVLTLKESQSNIHY
jgi:hypothetical protein